jgi:hypothetical protein
MDIKTANEFYNEDLTPLEIANDAFDAGFTYGNNHKHSLGCVIQALLSILDNIITFNQYRSWLSFNFFKYRLKNNFLLKE